MLTRQYVNRAYVGSRRDTSTRQNSRMVVEGIALILFQQLHNKSVIGLFGAMSPHLPAIPIRPDRGFNHGLVTRLWLFLTCCERLAVPTQHLTYRINISCRRCLVSAAAPCQCWRSLTMVTMASELQSTTELPAIPPPAYTASVQRCVITTQPKPATAMSVHDPEVLRMRGGCGAIVGAMDIQSGYFAAYTHLSRTRSLIHVPFLRQAMHMPYLR